MQQEPITLEFRGRIPSTKNRYTPRKGGKGMFKDPALQEELDRVALQIPGWARDLKLESPEVHVYLKYTKATYDRTNVWQALEDLLVKYGTLSNDNIKRANGLVSIHPAEKAEYDGATVVLIPQVEEVTPVAPRYIDPRRRRRLAPILCSACGSDRPDVCRMMGHAYPVKQVEPPPVQTVAMFEEDNPGLDGIWEDL